MDLLTEDLLPINIQVNHDVKATFTNVLSICERLSAQLNFQCMTSGWFGDEQEVLTLTFSLETSLSFEKGKRLFEIECNENNEFKLLSDDVCYSYKKPVNHINILISITDNELQLLTKNNNILKKYVEAKISKVVNLIAINFSLSEVPYG